VGDQQLAIDEVDIGLDAGKAVVERIDQWAVVLIVVVGVGPLQGDRTTCRGRSTRGQYGGKQ
jgi:hypothetical protein